mgnify:CR=1 FL=1
MISSNNPNLKIRSGNRKRKENTRDERVTYKVGETEHLLISFKYLDESQVPPGQTVQEWQKEGLLAPFVKDLMYLCGGTIAEALNKEKLKIYKSFPSKRSKFRYPSRVKGDVKWAVIRNIKGQKHRVAGFIENNIFYVVFLDSEHLFYLSQKSHT